MNKRQRITNISVGIISILGAFTIWASPEKGFYIIVYILCAAFILGGIKDVIFYGTMARHMVGGKTVLYKGIIMLDLGAFTLTLAWVPHAYIMMYLIGMLLFDGVIGIIRTMEQKGLGARKWKLNLSLGIINILIAISCIMNISSVDKIVLIYGIGLVYSGVVRIARALRRTDIVYIQ